MSAPEIIPPRIPFIDERTDTIAREWFHWLLAMRKTSDDNELLAMLSAFDGQAQTAQAQRSADMAVLMAQTPSATMDAEARKQLASVELKAYVGGLQAQIAELTKRLAEVELKQRVPQQWAELQKSLDSLALQGVVQRQARSLVSAARIAGRVNLRC